ncbi:MAG: V-type ATPase subunit [Actinobacteria bacterium]|nr:MAG: V-type ATPase subunit [Actinomycetota bacterium]
MRDAVVAPARRIPESDAGYAVARLRGMRSHLLDSAIYERLIATPDITTAVKELMETGYEPELEAALVQGRTSAVVDEALKNNMVKAYRKVLSFLDPASREVLSTILGRWDVFNVKTILRGAHNHVSFEETKASLLPAGYLSSTELEALAKVDDVRGVIDTMAMWRLLYAAPLRRAYPEYSRTNELVMLELALDRRYAEWASDRLVGDASNVVVARQILGTQVDTLNIVTAMRMINEDVDHAHAEQYFLEGGRVIKKEIFLELTKVSDVDDLLDRLKGTAYGDALDKAALDYLESQSIPVFERALEELLTRRALLSSVKDPYGVGIAIAYLWAKQNEVTNIRVIVHGKSVGMPADRVRKELILV